MFRSFDRIWGGVEALRGSVTISVEEHNLPSTLGANLIWRL